ncbi:unnamed protein product [Cuscuta europaea]|uniref:Uncharacterized protein n=1 Tax=Cuscuta europaea TaxID=41803 RepID=A0A9P1DVQ4_CUSEU|nr:unnamed protein product [Cuscuta europaea]
MQREHVRVESKMMEDVLVSSIEILEMLAGKWDATKTSTDAKAPMDMADLESKGSMSYVFVGVTGKGTVREGDSVSKEAQGDQKPRGFGRSRNRWIQVGIA